MKPFEVIVMVLTLFQRFLVVFFSFEQSPSFKLKIRPKNLFEIWPLKLFAFSTNMDFVNIQRGVENFLKSKFVKILYVKSKNAC